MVEGRLCHTLCMLNMLAFEEILIVFFMHWAVCKVFRISLGVLFRSSYSFL